MSNQRDIDRWMGYLRVMMGLPFPVKVFLLGIALVAVLVIVVPTMMKQAGQDGGPPPVASADGYPHLKMGNPSGAKDDGTDRDNFLMKKEFFALSYNTSKGTPNWVSWRLVKDDLGHAK